MVTSSGMRSPSMISRRKSKSVCDADGNPTSISLKPMSTNVVNIFILRTGSIGSISAWLPSRRSTEHQIGARSSTLFGQLRSRRPPLADPPCSGERGRNGRYFSKGIFVGEVPDMAVVLF